MSGSNNSIAAPWLLQPSPGFGQPSFNELPALSAGDTSGSYAGGMSGSVFVPSAAAPMPTMVPELEPPLAGVALPEASATAALMAQAMVQRASALGSDSPWSHIDLLGEGQESVLVGLQSEASQQLLKTLMIRVDGLSKQRSSRNELAAKKMEQSAQQVEKKAKKSIWQKILAVITKIFSYVAAVVGVVVAAAATIASGGAALPMLAFAGAMLVTMVANDISEAAGGPKISLTEGLTKLSKCILKACGVPPAKLDKAAALLGLALGVVLTVAAVGAGGASMAPQMIGGALMMAPDLVGNAAAASASLAGAKDDVAMYIGLSLTILAALGGAAAGMSSAARAGGSAAAKAASSAAKTAGAAAESAAVAASTATRLANRASQSVSESLSEVIKSVVAAAKAAQRAALATAKGTADDAADAAVDAADAASQAAARLRGLQVARPMTRADMAACTAAEDAVAAASIAAKEAGVAAHTAAEAAAESASRLSAFSNRLVRVGTNVEAGATIVAGAATVAKSAIDIDAARDVYASEMLMAEARHLLAQIPRINEEIKEIIDDIKTETSRMTDIFKTLSDTLKTRHEGDMQIADQVTLATA